MNNLDFKYLDLSCDYGACLWIKGRAINPEDLPISESLCQRINAFCEDYLNGPYEESDEWWENHREEKLKIAQLLQEELPHITARIFAYNNWKSIEMYVYEIEIIDGFERGANFWIGACKSENDKSDKFSYFDHVSDISGITLDEVFAFPYVSWFIEKYFEPSIQPYNDEYECNGFNWWGENYYTYDSVKVVIGDLKELIYLLQKKAFHMTKVIEWQDNVIRYGFDYIFLEKFNLYSEWRSLDKAGKYKFIENNCDIFINFYIRFINKMEKMMRDNSDCDLICFSGP